MLFGFPRPQISLNTSILQNKMVMSTQLWDTTKHRVPTSGLETPDLQGGEGRVVGKGKKMQARLLFVYTHNWLVTRNCSDPCQASNLLHVSNN